MAIHRTFLPFAIALIAITITICVFLPLQVDAATWDDLQAARARASQNLSNITNVSERTAIGRLIGLWQNTEDNKTVFNRMSADAQDRLIEQFDAYSSASPEERATKKQELVKKGAGACYPFISFDFYECIANPLATWMGSWFITIGGSILRLAGMIFDALMSRVIVDFKTSLEYLGVLTIVTNAWTFFRDLGNILIIGIFVFIAISLILGLKDYGQKKLIARVLIIAVLMNFSLLFAKLVIDASNFLAHTIYTQTQTAGVSGGVSQQFLNPMKITSVWDSEEIVKDVSAQSSGGALKAFAFGFFGGMLLLLIACVLFYGTFLIAARAIMLIFLMITAPIAFAMYLLPSFEGSAFGWRNWWKNLISTAVFAPLLVIFLSISILIVSGASTRVPANVTLGGVVSGLSTQTLADSWTILMLYLLGVGLLFVSFIMSSRFAVNLGGINFGQIAGMLPVAMGGRLAGMLGQQTFGRLAARRAENLGGEIKKARAVARDSGLDKDWKLVEKLGAKKASAEKQANRTFNMMNTALGKTLASKAGLKGPLTGESKGGFADKQHAIQAKAEARESAKPLSDSEKAALRKEAESNIFEANKPMLEEKKAARATAEETLKAAMATRDSAKKAQEEVNLAMDYAKSQSRPYTEAKAEVDHHESQKAVMTQNFEKELQSFESSLRSAGKNAEEIGHEMLIKRAEHQTVIDEQTAKITAAKERLAPIERSITEKFDAKKAEVDRAHAQAQTHFTTVQATYNAADRDYRRLESNTVNDARKAGNDAIAEAEKKSSAGIQYAAKKETGIIGRIMGDDKQVAHHIEDKYKKSKGSDSVLKALREKMDEGNSDTA